MASLFTAMITRDGLFELTWVDVQSPVHHLLGAGRRLVVKEAAMSEPVLAISHYDHIGFPVSPLKPKNGIAGTKPVGES